MSLTGFLMKISSINAVVSSVIPVGLAIVGIVEVNSNLLDDENYFITECIGVCRSAVSYFSSIKYI